MERSQTQLFAVLAIAEGGALQAAVLDALHQHGDGLPDELVAQNVLSNKMCLRLLDRVDTLLAKHQGDIKACIAEMRIDPDVVKEIEGALHGMGDDAGTLAPLDTSRTLDLGESGGGGTVVLEGRQKEPAEKLPADRTDRVPAVRETQDRYEELRVFAKGGMGKILLVHDNHLGRDIALKTLLPERAGPATLPGTPTLDMLTVPVVARFLQEARVTGQLEHPSIVPVYELGYRADGSIYYTMKLVRGETLQKVIERTPGFSERLHLLPNFLNLCQAIAYAHNRGVIHRDLKPLNVMIGEFGETVVIDWGIAKVQGAQDVHARGLEATVRTLHIGETEAAAHTVYGQSIGSPYYMPPEQASGRMEKVDERSDVYALGAILYAILSGDPPYKGSTAREFLKQVQESVPKPLIETEPKAPPELIAVCNRAMAPRHEDRYPSAKELMDEIERYIAGGLVSAYDYHFSELFKRFVKKHRKVLATAAAAVVALAAFAVFYNIRVTQQRNRAIVAEELAVDAREVAEDERARAERELYFALTALVPRDIEEHQMAAARDHLDQCPAAHRAWEWGHLLQRCNAEMATLSQGGRFVAFAGNHETLISGKANGTVTLSGVVPGTLEQTFIERAGFDYAVAASQFGHCLAVSGREAVSVWDTATGSKLFHHEDTGRPGSRHQVAISEDGQTVAALGSDRSVRVWNVATGAVIFSRKLERPQGGGAYLSPGGDRLLLLSATLGEDGWNRRFEVVALPEGARLGEAELQDPLSVHAAAFSPDGAWLAVGTDDGSQVWQLNPWGQHQEIPLRFGHPDTLSFSPDSRWIAAGAKDGEVGLWNVATKEGRLIPKAHSDTVRAIAFGPGGRFLATGGFDRAVCLWRVPDLSPMARFLGHDKAVLSVAFSPGGDYLASGGFDGLAKVWDLRADLDFASVDQAGHDAKRHRLAGSNGAAVTVWDTETGHRIMDLEDTGGRVLDLALGGAGQRLAALVNDGTQDTLRVFSVPGGILLSSRHVDRGRRDMAFAGRTLVLQQGGGLTILDIEAEREPWNVEAVEGFALSPSGKWLATAAPAAETPDRLVTAFSVWNAFTRSMAAQFQIDTGYPAGTAVAASLAFSPDESRFYAGTQIRGEDEEPEGRVCGRDLSTGQPTPCLSGHGGQVTCIAFSHDGRLMATGSNDDTVILWDIASGEQRVQLTGHADNVNDVAFSPDSRRLVTASQDGSFKLWDAATGRDVLTLHREALRAEGQVVAPDRVAFTPDGRQLVTLTAPAAPPMILRALPWDSPG